MENCWKFGRAFIAFTIALFLFLLSKPVAAQQQGKSDNVQEAIQAGQQDTLQLVAPPSQPSASNATSTVSTVGPDYIIGPEDVLDIDVFNLPELKQEVRVENDGTISVKLLGRVKVAGLTDAQVREKLESEWGDNYLEDPQVSVFIKEFHARPVSVIGGVAKPGLYPLGAQRTLTEMLSLAGGLATGGSAAAGRTVLVTRKGGFEALQPVEGMRVIAADEVEIQLRPLLYSHSPGLNIKIQPYDTIAVSKAGIVYVTGEVMKPGGFTLEDRESFTVMEALSLAGGTSANANSKAARIIHQSGNGPMADTHIDLSKLLTDKTQDVQLAANDILYIPHSSGKAAKHDAMMTTRGIVNSIAALLIFRGM